MYVSKAKDVHPVPVQRDIFTGEVHQAQHVDEKHGEHFRIGLVSFKPGGRTKWHTHPWEQGLVIIDGKGIVATEAQEQVSYLRIFQSI